MWLHFNNTIKWWKKRSFCRPETRLIAIHLKKYVHKASGSGHMIIFREFCANRNKRDLIFVSKFNSLYIFSSTKMNRVNGNSSSRSEIQWMCECSALIVTVRFFSLYHHQYQHFRRIKMMIVFNCSGLEGITIWIALNSYCHSDTLNQSSRSLLEPYCHNCWHLSDCSFKLLNS